MPLGDSAPDPDSTDFVRLVGHAAWTSRMDTLNRRTQSGAMSGRAALQRHAVEFALARAAAPNGAAKPGPAERHILALARDVVSLAERLPRGPRARLRARLEEGLSGEATLVPLWHLLRAAAQTVYGTDW